ncbi:MAG: TetR/AcrR family transcriptional regulator [Clostridiaceae bacterium]
MKIIKKNICKELIIETTLGLIEEKRGTKDVNLREIAKNIGCAHTNLYNYFNSLDDIFWEALGQVMLKMIDYVDTNLADVKDPEEKFYLMLSNIIDFSMEHPGWYKLIWFESISGKPSFEVNEMLSKPRKGFNAILLEACNNKISEEKVNLTSEIILTYLHGELSKWINHRGERQSKEETKMKILSNLKLLIKSLIKGKVLSYEN